MKKLALLGAGLGLLLFATPNEVSAGTSEITYTVQHGDTLSEIATTHEVSLPKLIENNPQIGNPNLIFPNQIISINHESSAKGAEIDEKRVVTAITRPTSTSSRVTINEHDLLSRLVNAEAKGESFAGKVAVAKVVLNRVNDGQFPNSIQGVIYQRNQFSPVNDGSINQGATQESRNAVDVAVAEHEAGDTLAGALFFYNPRTATSAGWLDGRPTKAHIGNHVFK